MSPLVKPLATARADDHLLFQAFTTRNRSQDSTAAFQHPANLRQSRSHHGRGQMLQHLSNHDDIKVRIRERQPLDVADPCLVTESQCLAQLPDTPLARIERIDVNILSQGKPLEDPRATANVE